MNAHFGRWLWGLITAGLVLRVALAFATTGSEFDLDSYSLAAEQLRLAPLDFYATLGDDAFRWPYPPLYLPWIALARELADATGLAFHGLIGLPAIAADAAIAWLVQDFLGRRGALSRTRLAAVALISFGPVFVVISGYHPQFDSLAILPAVGALWAWERAGPKDSRRAVLAGVLIGVGCALKTVPILMLLALLPSSRNRREALTLAAAAIAIPLATVLPFLISTPESVLGTFDYAGVPGAGGLSLAIQPEMAERWTTVFHEPSRLSETLLENRTAWTLLTTLFLGAFLFRHRTRPLQAAVILWLAIYVTGTGFFFQYLVWGLPFFLMAGHLRQVALIQAVVVVPMLLFYLGPWEQRWVAIPYGALMLALWVGMALWLVTLGRRERASARQEGRERAPLIGSAAGRLRDRLDAGEARRAARDRSPGGERPASGDSSRSRRESIGFAAVLLTLAVFSIVSLALLARAAPPGSTLTGADGPAAADQLVYLSWIRDLAAGGLIDNDYTLASSAEVYVHPMFLLSGAFDALTGALQVSYLLWKPVAVLLLFAGSALYVRRMLSGKTARFAALGLALFFASPAGPLVDWLGVGGAIGAGVPNLTGEAFTASLLFGYLPAAIAVGLLPVFLLSLEKAVDPNRRAPARGPGLYLAVSACSGALAAWIHPWQGLILLAIAGGLFIWAPAGMRRRALLVPAVATLIPVLYLFALSELSPAWELAREANTKSPLRAHVVLLALAPLALPALLGLAKPAIDSGERMLRLWPLAVIVVHYALSPTVPNHAFEGVALPLAVLAVRGWQTLDISRATVGKTLALGSLLALIVPGAAWTVAELEDRFAAREQAHFLLREEKEALEYLRDSPTPGGVLATVLLGGATPPYAGRQAWVGHPSFTPDYVRRATASEDLFNGELGDEESRRLVASTGAVFLLSDCRGRADLTRALDPLLLAEHDFGCATVYELRPGA